MELKVWVEGIQRVVCGVTSNTSCHDVVLALAVATNQTGRFTLIEKWRNNERLLSSSEKPLEVLSKWGEYSNDVHFVLKRSDDINGHKTNLSHSSPSSFKDVFQQQVLQQQQQRRSNSSSSSSCCQSPANNTHNHNHHQSPVCSRILQPQNNLKQSQPQSPQKQQQHEATPSTEDNTVLPNDHCYPPSATLFLPSPKSPQSSPSSSSKKYKNVVSVGVNGRSKSSPSTSSSTKSSPSKGAKKHEQQLHEPMCGVQKNQMQTTPSRGRLVSSEERTKLRGSTPVVGSKVSGDRLNLSRHQVTQMRDRTMLSSSSEDRMEVSDSKESLNSVAAFRNKSCPPSQTPPAPALPTVCPVVNGASGTSKVAGGSSFVLGESLLSEESRRIKEDVEKKRKERDQLLARSSDLDAKIAVYRHKIQLLSDRIKEEEHQIEMEQVRKEREDMLIHQDSITQLKIQIAECQQELNQQKKESDAIQEEIRSVEAELINKYSEMESVMIEIRKENLNALSLETCAVAFLTSSIANSSASTNTSPFAKLHSENVGSSHFNSLIGSKFYHRIGSTRKIGSPRQLQTVVASKKNPQGVWV